MPVEQVSPELERIVSAGQDIEELGRGYQAAEGPVWYKNEGFLLFSDVVGNRRMKWAPNEGISVFQEPTNHAIGLTRDPQGPLVVCEGGGTTTVGEKGAGPTGRRCISRVDTDGNVTVAASNYQGKLLNRPNDVVVKSDGSIYFTDPGAPDTELDLDFAGVYRVSPDLGTITALVRNFLLPNGLAFSPDESILYIDDSSRRHIRAFDMQPNGTLALGTDRIFLEFTGDRPGMPDGMKVDVEGNVYCAAPGGVWIIDPTGKYLGTILTGSDQTTNCAWGGEDWKTLFITTIEALYRIQLKIPGIPVPN